MTELLHTLFERAAGRYPSRIAIEIPPGPGRPAAVGRSYDELLTCAQQLRARISRHVSRESVVAIALPKSSPDLHAAQIAILQAGAGFTCLDLDFPDEHIRFILRDADVGLIVVDKAASQRLRVLGVDAIEIAVEEHASQVVSAGSLRPPEWLGPRSIAYVIYTSGTTGPPKGVIIEHRSIVHLLEAEQEYLQLQPEDRCAQISSNVYDSSIEEGWLAFAAGAAVVVADEDVVRLGPDLVPWLRDQGISVLMPTPTLLRTTGCTHPAREMPDLRLVYTGGEAITEDLVEPWANGIQLENGYGPTECTITVTRARLRAGEAVTIGRVIGDSCSHVLDQNMQPVDVGQAGELCFSGPCLARGYLDRFELTKERFPHHERFGRIYRTGDLATVDEQGNLLYLGRMDSQVKVRGYRIELSAIEVELQRNPLVSAAACSVQGGVGSECIVAHLVLEAGTDQVDTKDLAAELLRVLPDYMVPSRFSVLDCLPTLVSGKIDRSALPPIIESDIGPVPAGPSPRSNLERLISSSFGDVLGVEVASVEADFFALGGNSLRAAELITILRRDSGTSELTVRDVYECRTPAALSIRAQSAVAPNEGVLPCGRPLRGVPIVVSCLQTLWLSAMLVGGSYLAYLAIYVMLPWLIAGAEVWLLVLISPAAFFLLFVLYTPIALVLAALAKRMLIGRYQSCRAPAWGGLYLRNWLVQRCVMLVPWELLRGTELFNIGLRMLGAEIGKRVHVHRGVDLHQGGWDLLTIGDDVSLSQDADVGLVEYDDGDIVFDHVSIGEGSTLAVRAGMQGGSSLGRHAVLAPLSSLSRSEVVPDGELWDRVPAVRVGIAPTRAKSAVKGARLSPFSYGLLLISLRSLLNWALLSPALMMICGGLLWMDVRSGDVRDWLRSPSLGLPLLMVSAGLVVMSLVSRLLLSALILRFSRSVETGCYHLQSVAYLRIWFRTGLSQDAGRWLSGSIYWRWWLRCAGMNLGRNCEISTIIDVLPEHVAIGGETFFADGVYLACPRLHQGVATVSPTSIGAGSFVGNHALIPAGSDLPAQILVGVSTVADQGQVRAGTSWFGHPPIELPQREIVEIDRTLTHDPTVWLYLHRLCWESLRFFLPAVASCAFLAWVYYANQFGVIWLPLVTVVIGIVLLVLVLSAKWLLLGRVRPGTHGLWSAWCCRWDFLYMMWGMLAHRLLSPLSGTLLLPWYLRAMGMRIGRRVVLAGSFAQVVDPDMLTIEDGATVDPMFQAHTFEDRVLKIGPVHIAKDATVGRSTVLFYGSRLGERSSVAPHSVVMKNESLSPGRRYAGCPTRPMPTRSKS